MIGILAILVVTLSIIIATQNVTKDSERETDTSLARPSPTNSQAPSPTLTLTPSLKQNGNISEDNQPTSIQPTSTSTKKSNQSSETIPDFQYPSSIVVSKTENTATLESTDDPKKITNWYKDKIKALNMNVTTFVQTSTNGNILNKLVGANGNTELRIEITKQNNSQTVNIFVFSL